jgi:lipopolysaccharide/colanic/teichoic acid biosynthesis glycosyltransferase
MRDPYMPWSKRACDILLSGAALLVLSPVFLLVPLVIKLSSTGPVFYVAPRAGRRGVTFGQLKFRTMHAGSDRSGAFTAKNDSRVFAAGRVLRLFKVDELPQLINVLRGEMSIVGPRPEEVNIVAECYTPAQREVLEAVPGLTGLPQVRFFPELSVIDPEGMDPQEHYRQVILPMRLDMDLEYVRNRSFWYDARLIARTMWLIAVRPWGMLREAPAPVSLPRTAKKAAGRAA